MNTTRLFRRVLHSIFDVERSFSSSLNTVKTNKQAPRYIMEKWTPATKKIDSDEFRNLLTPQLNKLAAMFSKRGYLLRIAGGPVRDLLMGIQPADIDFATTATPSEMKELFTSEGIRMLHKRGEEHGTITCRIDDLDNFEITTLRIDILCDGRRAEVEYTTDWQLDANRRDLTINSMFLDLDGNVVDYFGGIEDVEQRKVAFVGNAEQRIQEDFLRILRYFRFFGRISNSDVHDPETFKAIIDNKHGLQGISAERIWTELKKIVIGRMAPEVLKAMLVDCSLNQYLGLPDNCNLERLEKIYKRFSGSLEPMTMIAALCEDAEQIAKFHSITKLSNDERLMGEFIINERATAEKKLDDVKWWVERIVEMEVRPGHESTIDKLRKRTVQLAKSVMASDELVSTIQDFKCPAFPVTGVDMMKAGVAKGPGVRNVLLYLFDLWKNSYFTLTKEDLLLHAHDEDIPDLSKPKKKDQSRSNSPKRRKVE